jgi:hypothetical protein
MIVEKVLHNRKELRTIVENWSVDGESLLIFERDDTLVLKKMKKSITAFADDSFDDEMTMEEVVNEVHKNRLPL